jgi:large subunit ribosomal protein LP0
MPSATKLEKKEAYHNRLCDYLNTFDKAFVVHADNVGSKQMSDIRAALPPTA